VGIQGRSHEFEGEGWFNVLEGWGGQYRKTLKFEKDGEVHDPPPPPSSYGGAVPDWDTGFFTSGFFFSLQYQDWMSEIVISLSGFGSERGGGVEMWPPSRRTETAL